MRPASGTALRRRGGFTLIEVLAAIFLTTIVITTAVSIYVNLSNSAQRATDMMRVELHAASVLDRVGHDLETASLLVKKPDEDPLAHPWYFVAESRQSFGGADRVKFVSRSQKPRASNEHGSDLAQIVYFTERQEDGTLTVYRWLALGLPAQYPLEYPGSDDDRSFILAEGVDRFELRFLSETGEWSDEWDSTQLVDSTQLPIAVEVGVSFAPDPNVDARFVSDEEPVMHTRTVMLSSRPLDLNLLIEEKVAAEAEAEQIAAGTGAGGTANVGGQQGSTASCMDICLGSYPQDVCSKAFASAEASPVAATLRAQFNCR